MKRRNELLVGAIIALAAVIGFFGVRYLQGTPLLHNGYTLQATFDDAGGVHAGSVVRVNGVRVGRVKRVRLAPGGHGVTVEMEIDPRVGLTRGASVETVGLAALGDVSLAIRPAPDGALLRNRDTLAVAQKEGFFNGLQSSAPQLLARAETTLGSAAGTLAATESLLSDPHGDLRLTLAALHSTTAALDQMLRSERVRLSATLQNVEQASSHAATLSGNLATFSTTQSDSLANTIHAMNQAIGRLDAMLLQANSTTAELESMLAKMNRGDGTLGLMLNDPSLYHNLNNAVGGLNEVMADFQRQPGRYLRELRLIKVF